jgi:hypothetical protein
VPRDRPLAHGVEVLRLGCELGRFSPALTKGHSKKKVTDPCVYVINFRGTNQPQSTIFLGFFLVRFWAFLGEGSSKTRLLKKMQKVHVKNFSRENSQKIDKISMLFFLDFFCFIAFSGASLRWEFKNTTKNVLQNNRVEKFLQNNRQKIPNRFFLDFF